MRKSLLWFTVLAALCCLCASAFALSDADYKKMMRDKTFANADKALNTAWKEAKQSLSKDAFEALKKGQQAWVKSGRDNRAKELMNEGLSKTAAYAQATNERAADIAQLVHGGGGEDFDVMGGSGYDSGLPDLPDEVPAAKPQSNPSKPSASKKLSLSTSEEASDALMDFLYQLDRVSPGEELQDLDTQTDISGEACWEFALMSGGLNMMMETGRYAISPSGKVYELNDDKYAPLKAPEQKASKKSDAAPENSEPVNAKGTINGNKVNVRKRPTTKANVVKQLNAGHPVDVLESSEAENGLWYHIRTASGTEGWVFEDFLQIN